MTVIVINGMPGSGKTTIAFTLASMLGIEQVVQTDVIKEILKINNYPEISYCPSHKAWEFFGIRNAKNIISGFEMHCRFFENYLLSISKIAEEKGKTIIIEGVQAIPNFFKKLKCKKIGFYLYLNDEKEHIRRFKLKNKKRVIKNNGWFENFEIIRLLDSYMVSLASEAGMQVIDNSNFFRTINEIVKNLNDGILKNEIQRLRLCIR